MHDLSPHALRREHLLAEAVQAAKFLPDRAAYWRAQYDADPAATEHVLAALAPVPQALAGTPAAAVARPYPPELFPELARHERRAPIGRTQVETRAAQPDPL